MDRHSAFCILHSALCLSLVACSRTPEVAVGNPAPPFSARTITGDSVALASLAGRPVLVNVWATWCEPCLKEIPYLEQLYSARHADGLELVGVSVDAPGAEDGIRAFVKEQGMNYPIWYDPDRRVTAAFRSFGVPASYVVDRRGTLRWQHVGIIRATDTGFLAVLDSVIKERATP
jgi:peroxiredoxin